MKKKKKNSININKSLILKISVSILSLLVILLVIFNSKKVSTLERLKITEYSDQTINYVNNIIDSEDKGRYIVFSIDYIYNNENINSISFDKVIDTINKTFNLKYDKNTLNEIGITEEMAKNGISLLDDNKYNYNNKKTKLDIANTEILYLKMNKIAKKNKKTFYVTYDRYRVESPYEILNYYNDYNVNASLDNKKTIDTSLITNYLDGKGKIKDIISFIDENNIDKFSKKIGSIKVTYKTDGDKLYIDNIKK